MAQVFVAKIARNRGTSRETVVEKYGRGGTIVGQGAVDAGMVDAVGSFEGVLADLAGGKTIFAPFPAARAVTAAELKKENVAVYDSIHEEGRLAGYEEGKKAGYDSGHSEGFKSGLEAEAYSVAEIVGLADAYPDDPGVPGIIVRELKRPNADKGAVASLLVTNHVEALKGPTDAEIDAAVAAVNSGRK
jgi:ClpP class serine protease